MTVCNSVFLSEFIHSFSLPILWISLKPKRFSFFPCQNCHKRGLELTFVPIKERARSAPVVRVFGRKATMNSVTLGIRRDVEIKQIQEKVLSTFYFAFLVKIKRTWPRHLKISEFQSGTNWLVFLKKISKKNFWFRFREDMGK